jgi:asparagine synthase (glutamine-hydrolysing)
MVYHHDSPFSDAANIPLYLLGQEVKGSVKVVLQGDGGDEIFAGYRRYATLSNRFLWWPFAPWAAKLHNVLERNNSDFYSRQRYLNALANPNEAELMALLLTVEDKFHSPLNVFSKSLQERIADIDPFSSYKECNKRFCGEDIVQRMLYTDTQLVLPNIFLEKVDRSTMAASIEVRVPLLDNLLTGYVMQLPSQLKVKRGEKKWLLKKAMENILPDSILYSKKTGFGVPYQLWLKGPLNELFHDKLSQLQARNCDVLNWVYIDRLMNENLTGHRDHSFMLWKVLNLMIWLSNNE